MRVQGAIFKILSLCTIKMRQYLSIKEVKNYIMSIQQKELHDFEAYIKENVSEQIYLDVIENWIKGMYEGYNHTNPPPDIIEMKLITKLHKRWKKGNDALWLTISPDHLKNPLKFTARNLDNVSEFCRKWFTDKRYSFYHYVIEAGENKEDPHLHVHALVQLKHKSMAKNHARDLKGFWGKKTFNKLKGKDYYSQNVNGIYRSDKLDYMDNHAKGSHENYIDNPFDDDRMENCRADRYTHTKGELL